MKVEDLDRAVQQQNLSMSVAAGFGDKNAGKKISNSVVKASRAVERK